MKVLLIGSDMELTRLTGKILHRNDYDICCAGSFEDAATALSTTEFALVIMDYEFGETRRKQILDDIKGHGGPRVLCISGNPEDEVAYLNAGADDWIKKPYHVDVLLARMSALLRQERVLIKTPLQIGGNAL